MSDDERTTFTYLDRQPIERGSHNSIRLKSGEPHRLSVRVLFEPSEATGFRDAPQLSSDARLRLKSPPIATPQPIPWRENAPLPAPQRRNIIEGTYSAPPRRITGPYGTVIVNNEFVIEGNNFQLLIKDHVIPNDAGRASGMRNDVTNVVCLAGDFVRNLDGTYIFTIRQAKLTTAIPENNPFVQEKVDSARSFIGRKWRLSYSDDTLFDSDGGSWSLKR